MMLMPRRLPTLTCRIPLQKLGICNKNMPESGVVVAVNTAFLFNAFYDEPSYSY